MSLIEELQVSLKDFLPKEHARNVIAEPGGIQYVVGDRLYAELTKYAKRQQIATSTALRLLRDEIGNAS